MATVSQMIRAVSKEKNVLQNIVEKDYALSYLLSAIYSVFCYELVVGWVRNPPRLWWHIAHGWMLKAEGERRKVEWRWFISTLSTQHDSSDPTTLRLEMARNGALHFWWVGGWWFWFDPGSVLITKCSAPYIKSGGSWLIVSLAMHPQLKVFLTRHYV